MGGKYEQEIKNLPLTYKRALTADLSSLKDAIASTSGSSIIGVGSGGSYTVSSFLCDLHETYTGRVSRASTPLEIICNPTLASASPVFLISAEGKNPDIIEALIRARRNSARSINIISNRSDSILIEKAKQLRDVRTHIFELEHKDGYLATNSLLLDAMVVARAYQDLDGGERLFPPEMMSLPLKGYTLTTWADAAENFVKEAIKRSNIIIIFSPRLKSIACDLESKLAEAALLHCQLADIRSFAHGRHLWLSHKPENCAIFALTDPSLEGLWCEMSSVIPAEIPQFTMPLSGISPQDLISGLIAQMLFVDRIGKCLMVDPGKPEVQNFGRELYYLDLSKHIARCDESLNEGERSKFEVLGGRWPAKIALGNIERERATFLSGLESQNFKCIVFDYDGTLCSSQERDAPPPAEVVERIETLLKAGIIVGVASGRGGSLHQHFKEVIDKNLWSNFKLALYNGGWIGELNDDVLGSQETSEFLNHIKRLVGRLKELGAPINNIRVTHPYQVSVRFQGGTSPEEMWYVIADAVRQAGLDLARMVKSKHSVDVLAEGVSKSRLIAHIIEVNRVRPYQILTMGDQGAWPGNDAALLEHKYSLSVDQPSRRVDRGWKLAPPHKRDVDATLWYLDKIIIGNNQSFSLKIDKAE